MYRIYVQYMYSPDCIRIIVATTAVPIAVVRRPNPAQQRNKHGTAQYLDTLRGRSAGLCGGSY